MLVNLYLSEIERFICVHVLVLNCHSNISFLYRSVMLLRSRFQFFMQHLLTSPTLKMTQKEMFSGKWSFPFLSHFWYAVSQVSYKAKCLYWYKKDQVFFLMHCNFPLCSPAAEKSPLACHSRKCICCGRDLLLRDPNFRWCKCASGNNMHCL